MHVQIMYYVHGVQAFSISLCHASTALRTFIGKGKTLMLRTRSYVKLTGDVMVMLRKLNDTNFYCLNYIQN